MIDINPAVDYAVAQSGKPYRAYGDRFGPSYYDCSGLVIGSLRHAGISVPSDVGNTVGLYNWAERVGGLISVSRGVGIRGAIMIKGKDYGYGPLGHTSFSLGDGREMAAHGYRSGVNVSTLNASFYQDAFLIPGVDYHLEPPVDPDVLAALVRLEQWRQRVHARPLRFGDQNADAAILVDLLRAKHFLNKSVHGNKYGKTLQTGVYKFKLVVNLGNTVGTAFGGDAADALLTLP